MNKWGCRVCKVLPDGTGREEARRQRRWTTPGEDCGSGEEVFEDPRIGDIVGGQEEVRSVVITTDGERWEHYRRRWGGCRSNTARMRERVGTSHEVRDRAKGGQLSTGEAPKRLRRPRGLRTGSGWVEKGVRKVTRGAH